MTKTCAKCGKTGPVAEDQTDAGSDEMALDSRALVSHNSWVCGECLSDAELPPFGGGKGPDMGVLNGMTPGQRGFED